MSALPIFNSTIAMHIAEGFLPQVWSFVWYGLFAPFFILSMVALKKQFATHSSNKLLFALMAAFAFTLSSLKIPSIVGSCSHPTGMGLGSILLGPLPMVAIGTVVLLMQALLIAHGGITTLGANAMSMAVVGPFVTFGLYKLMKKMGVTLKVNIFISAIVGNLATYLLTSLQLGAAFSGGDFMGASIKFMGVFMLTQVPIALAEGLLTIVIFNLLSESKQFPVLKGGL